MTLFHFGNCLALVYVPFYLIYKYSGLAEYGAFWKCIQAGSVYAFTQLCKMLILATFFPTTESNIQGDKDAVWLEFMKTTVDLADLFGMLFVLNGIPGKGHAKLLTAGVGWAGAEALLSRAALLWFGARGAEFSWKYLQKCFDTNISLAHHITVAALVFLWNRHDRSKNTVPILGFLLLLCAYKSFLLELFLETLIDPWSFLAIKAIITIFLGLVTLKIYSGVAESIGIY